jgi:hypothetical protein
LTPPLLTLREWYVNNKNPYIARFALHC